MRRMRGVIVASGLLALAICTTAALAQDFEFRWRRLRPPIQGEKTPYDGRFTFARLRHGYEIGREPPWAHDYPRAERNFTRILQELTMVAPNIHGSNVLRQDDPDLFTSPVLYVSEPGFWTMSDAELAGVRAYVHKGGFIIFDDFSARHWLNFEEKWRKAFPGLALVKLDQSHPVFDSFYRIKSIDMTHPYFGLKSEFWGAYEDNDPTKRLVMVANYNNDIGDYMEWSDQGLLPVPLTNEAYKIAVNYVVYALTH